METKKFNDLFSYENTENKLPTLKWIPIDDLVIPAEDEEICKLKDGECFQRNEYRDNVRKSRSWDWAGVMCLGIGKYNGVLYVYDGGNRLRAARKNGKIKKMPCAIVEFNNLKELALAYLLTNTNRKNNTIAQKHRAGLFAGDPLAKTADKMVSDSGYQICDHAGEFKFTSVAALYRLIKIDLGIAERTFQVSASIANGDTIYKEFLFGMFELELRSQVQRQCTIFTDANIQKLEKAGMITIIRAINDQRAISGKSGGSQSRVIPAIGILKIINKGKGKGRTSIKFIND